MPPDLKTRVWTELSRDPRPPFATARAMDKLIPALWHDEEFWADLLDRHGLRHKSIADLSPQIREHAISNFWGMLAQTAQKLGLKV